MKINSINSYNTPNYHKKNQIRQSNIIFMGSVKTTERLVNEWYDKLPVTFREFLDSVPDKSKITPVQALREAFLGLSIVENIQEVKIMFPKECEGNGIFRKLKDLTKKKVDDSLLGIYSEFKELYKNGVLKSGEDITVYLLKKLYLDAKSRKQINEDLENDIIDDIKNEFKRRKVGGNDEYVPRDAFLKTYGIIRLDNGVQTFFRHIDEKYNKQASEIGKALWDKLPQEEKDRRAVLLHENYKKWIENLTDEQKEKWLKKRVNSWEKLTPEQITDLIIKIRGMNEYHRYAMFDAWNQSENLIMELSRFLKSKHESKPEDLLFTDKEFSKFQSMIMTEFWDVHRDLAVEFGRTLKNSILKVRASVEEGHFENLKAKIWAERAERIERINAEKLLKEEKIKEAEQNIIKEIKPVDYKSDFKTAYRENMNPEKFLPASYVDEMSDIMLETFPKNVLEKLTECYKANLPIPDEIRNILTEESKKNNNPRVERIQRALEVAIAEELCNKGASPVLYDMQADTIINIYKKRMKEAKRGKKYPDVKKIETAYENYKKDITDREIKNISDMCFIYKDYNVDVNEYDKMLNDYIKTYGRTIFIPYSDKITSSVEVKNNFNEKFLRLMPNELKDAFQPIFSSVQDFADEKHIKQITDTIKAKFIFMPKEFRDAYTQEVAHTIRLYRVSDASNKSDFTIQSYKERMCKNITQTDEYEPLQYLQFPKEIASRTNKIRILAAEQALADEIHRITGDDTVYGCAVETLCSYFEIFNRINSKELVQCDSAGNEAFKLTAQNKPEQWRIYPAYCDYIEKIKENENDIFDNDFIIKDTENLFLALKPKNSNDVINENIKNRIKGYLFN